MRRRWKILLLAACGLVAVVAVCFFCVGEREPSYNGKTLSEWLDQCWALQREPNSPQHAVAVAAVKAIGTNGFPCLLAWSDKGSRGSELLLSRLADQTPAVLKFKCVQNWTHGCWVINNRALVGFYLLQTNTERFLPDMERRFLQTTNEKMLFRLSVGMKAMGPQALDFCLDILRTNRTNARVRAAINAIDGMHYLGTNVIKAVPALARAMQDSDADIRTHATTALAWIAPEVLTNGAALK